MGALQKKVNDVGKPEHVEDTCDAKEHHGVAPVRTMTCMVPPLTSLHLLAGETSPSLTDLPIMLLTNAKDVKVGEADHKGCWSVQQAHNKACKQSRGRPEMSTPLKDIPMVAWLPPTKKGWQEHNAGVDPDQDYAAAQTAWCHQLIVGQGLSNSQVAIYTYAGQASHRNTLQHWDYVAEHLACKGFLDTSWVVQQRESGHQATQPHQEVCIGHSLDKVTGGVVVQQRGTMKHEDDRQIPSYNEHSEQHNEGSL